MKIKYRECLKLLFVECGRRYNHKEISQLLGGVPTANALANRYSCNGYLSEEEVSKLSNATKVNFNVCNLKAQNKNIELNYYPDVFGSCGAGAFTPSENKEVITLPQKLIKSYSSNKNYSIINAIGESMQPYILNNDKLIIEHVDSQSIIDNRIYVFCFEDRIFVKRLVYNINELAIISDNPDKEKYHTIHISANELKKANFILIGQVVGILRHTL